MKRKPAESLSPRKLVASGLTFVAILVMAMIIMKQCSDDLPAHASMPGYSGGDTIDVAIEYGPSTIEATTTPDSMTGFAYSTLMAIGADSMIFKFHPVASLARGLEMLRRGAADVVVAEMATTAGFDSTLRFTEPVRLDRQVLVQRVDSDGSVPVTSVLELAGRSVWVPAGSPMLARLRNIELEIGDSINIIADSVHGSEQLFLMVAVGDIEFAVVNRLTAARLVADYPQVNIDKGISFTQFQSWVIRGADSVLGARLDSAIVRLRRPQAS